MAGDEAIVTAGYEEVLAALKERILGARVRAARAVNRELALLYWGIGRGIPARQREQGRALTNVERTLPAAWSEATDAPPARTV